MAGEMPIPFGKFGPSRGDQRTVEATPSDYLRYLLEQEDDSGWVSSKYGQALIDDIEYVLAARDRGDSHWNEAEETDLSFLRE